MKKKEKSTNDFVCKYLSFLNFGLSFFYLKSDNLLLKQQTQVADAAVI